jgi:hypothetical protein
MARPAPGLPAAERGMPVVNCVAGAKLVSRARTLLWSHLTQIDQMKDSPTA